MTHLSMPYEDSFRVQENPSNPLLPLFDKKGNYMGLHYALVTGEQGFETRGKIVSLSHLNVRSIRKKVDVAKYGHITMLTWEMI
jgi:hypothetical protein